MKALDEAMRRLGALLIQREGPLTRELVQEPGRFGLGRMPAGLVPDQVTSMVCGFCSTGCSLNVLLKDGAAVGLTPTVNYPVNLGAACPKGWEALTALHSTSRATLPLLRKQGRLVPVEWPEALSEMVTRFKGIQRDYGASALAWLGTGQMPTEELALLGALGKLGMGILHGDGNTRQCMATAATAYKQSFGFDAPPFSYRDLEESDVLLLIGSNPCIAHPILWQRVCNNPHRPEIIAIDPRLTETAAAATSHYAIEPKSDLVLLYSVANELIKNGWIDRDYVREHTSGFEQYSEHVARFTPESSAAQTGISAERIRGLARTIARGKRVSFWWTMGVNQSHQGTRTAQAIIALALMTGNMGRPGTGANSITGQCNAMGSRLFSNTASLFGGRDFKNPAHRAEVARILGLDVSLVPTEPSLTYDQIVDQIDAGEIRGLWVIATNPAHSWIDQSRMRRVLQKLECLVVQDMYHDTETAELADIVLPAAGWGEKEGTFINSERRLGVIKRVSRAPGQALSDFYIFQLVAEAWGCGELLEEWSSPQAVFEILKRLSRGLPCDISGIADYAMLEREGGVQWPFAEGASHESNERRLFEDGRYFTPDARARFLFCEPEPLPEPADAQYPLILLTGRGSSSQWHTDTRTRCSSILKQLAPRAVHVEISASDAAKYGISPGERVELESRRGKISAYAFVTHSVRPGELFVAMHNDSVNRLTLSAFDPHSRQPAFKACAVRIAPFTRGASSATAEFAPIPAASNPGAESPGMSGVLRKAEDR